MNYKIQNTDNGYTIVERDTGHIIGLYSSSTKAQIVKCILNSGAGFDGWTPEFFVRNLTKN